MSTLIKSLTNALNSLTVRLVVRDMLGLERTILVLHGAHTIVTKSNLYQLLLQFSSRFIFKQSALF